MKPNTHFQPGEDAREIEIDSERIIRRMVLEIIPALAEWADTQPALTKEMVQSTARRKSLYEHGADWDIVLQNFLKLDLEVIRLKNPLNFYKILERGDCPEITARLKELGDQAEETLLACWHKDSGLIMVSWPDTDNIPRSIQPSRKITFPFQKELVALWSWSKYNFPHPASDD